MSTHELVCKELVELVTDYLEGTLAPEARARFEAHLADCDGCSHYVAQMRQMIRLSGMLSEADLTPESRKQLLRIFRDWKRELRAD